MQVSEQAPAKISEDIINHASTSLSLRSGRETIKSSSDIKKSEINKRTGYTTTLTPAPAYAET